MYIIVLVEILLIKNIAGFQTTNSTVKKYILYSNTKIKITFYTAL